MLDKATGDSVLVMNESFASTTLRDALLVGERVLDRMTALGLLGVYVTFVDELASRNAACVSLVGTVVPDNPAERTFRIVRKPADRLAYAAAIGPKYRPDLPATEGTAGLMKAFLMYPDRDFDLKRDLPPNEADLSQRPGARRPAARRWPTATSSCSTWPGRAFIRA